MTRNLPVPAFEAAPVDFRWLWYIGPPAGITWLYRTIFPAWFRGLWNPGKGSNSHAALAAILAGGGWRAWFRFAVPRIRSGGPPWWFDPTAGITRGPWWDILKD